jgi:H+/Cl- antiporter ClcA
MPVKNNVDDFSVNQQKASKPLNLILKWLLISLLLSALIGTASALFLESLNAVTNWRENHKWIIAFLPLAGFAIGLSYYYWGKEVIKGNNLLIEELQTPQKRIPLIMAPLIFTTTLITHLFGGSAGREGTAVQIGGALADQFTKYFKLRALERKVILICGIAGGFASVFGTPVAGLIFGLEVFMLSGITFSAIVPATITAFLANYICTLWGATHTHYSISEVPNFSLLNLIYVFIGGIAFGLAARLFSTLMHKLSPIFGKIKYATLRPVIGGIILVAIIYFSGTTKFIGLGIPTIIESFNIQQDYSVFLIKILLTALTLSSGFKGGEVTPLFFIGATLGSFLSLYLPLPVSLLAGLGFVAVFAGAANTPLACLVMGIELFGYQSSIYLTIACITAYLFSGHKGIYSAQKNGVLKYKFLKRHPFIKP